MGSENAATSGVARILGATKASGTCPPIQGAVLGLALLLGGCSSMPAALNPVEWWHGLQGGKIAEDRPAPPNANDPYPNLGTVPARPVPSDPKWRQQIADGLIADRTNAQHEAAGTQLADPSNPAAAPGLFGRGSARPPAPAATPPGAASASMPATDATTAPASAPPPAAMERPSGVSRAPMGAPVGAPVGAVQSAPLAQPEEARLALPNAPPAPANLPGAPASAPLPADRPASAAPADVTPVAATPAAIAAVAAGRSVGVPFATGSAAVPRPSLAALRQLAARRAGANIAIIGFGEAASSDAAAQTAALDLALARAQAVAGALTTAGVPASAIRVQAEAAGRGAAARLVE